MADSVKTATVRAMLPKDILERFFDGPFHYEDSEPSLPTWENKLAGQDASSGAQPMNIGQVDKSEGEGEDVNAVQQRRTFDRPNKKKQAGIRQRAVTLKIASLSFLGVRNLNQESKQQVSPFYHD